MARDGNCTVLVASCDKYADLIPPFSTLWRKFWPDCPFETWLVAESIVPVPGTAGSPFQRVLACGCGGNWCTRLVKALDKVSTPYVLLLCDDYFLASPVDSALMLSRLCEAMSLAADNLRLIPNPVPNSANSSPVAEHSGLCQYRPLTAYCIATQAGFWRKDFLRTLASKTASIWEFERYGSFAPETESRRLLVTEQKEFPFVDAVHKGCWEKFGLAVCRENGIEVDLKFRGLPSLKTRVIEGLKALVFAIFPATLIVRVQNALDVGKKERH